MGAEILFNVSLLPPSSYLICKQKHEKSNCSYSKYFKCFFAWFFFSYVVWGSFFFTDFREQERERERERETDRHRFVVPLIYAFIG